MNSPTILGALFLASAIGVSALVRLERPAFSAL
jgi:hypothetical protein